MKAPTPLNATSTAIRANRLLTDTPTSFSIVDMFFPSC
jgi:hypothetical protein